MAYTDLDSIHVPSAGNRPPASWGAQVNANFDHVYDEVLAKLGAWTSWTPTVTQAGSITKTVNYAKYLKLGRTVIAQASLSLTGAGSSATAFTVSLPATAATSNIIIGTLYFYDASGTQVYFAAGVSASTSTVAGVMSGGNGGQLGATTFTGALASGDLIIIDVTYESAT